MQRAWLVLLAGCGFQSGAATTGDAMDASAIDASAGAAFCSTIMGKDLKVKACPTSLADMIDISDTSMATTLDTSADATNPPAISCAPVDSSDTVDVCVLAAKTIRIEVGATLAVQGKRPLALFAHTIDIEGTIDVASHIGSPAGPGADPAVCGTGTGLVHAKGDGGGQGGTFDRSGGNGGDGGTGNDQGGKSASTANIDEVRGGCPGWESGNGNVPGAGGHGGGAVWISVDTGTLTIGAMAVINASGASGAGGMAANKHGGYGGGSGGLIVLQASNASNLVLSPMAKIFANGGHGGGGAGTGDGSAGIDPNGPASSGSGGAAGTPSGGPGAGGAGFPAASNGVNAGNGAGNGGGGGGGGAGAIRMMPYTAINDSNHVSPEPAPP